jgi:PKD repeat protein
VTPPVVVTPTPRPPTTNNSGGPQAVINAIQTTVLVGEGIEVNGLNSVLHTGDPLTTQYHWDFGDPTGKYDALDGFNAGHVYDDPGVYTISLRVTDANGHSSLATTQVTIESDNRPVIYVDTHGSDANDGSSPGQAVATAARALQLASSDASIEFRRGETFAVNSTIQLNGHDLYVGAYGSGASPVLKRGAGDGTVTLFLTPTAQNVTIQNITFDSIYTPVNGVAPKINDAAVWANGTNVVVRDCIFLNVDDAIDGEMKPTGVIVMDNTSPLLTGLRSYFTWVDGTDWSILGNTVANSTREHVIRSNSMDTDRVLIADNNLTNTTNSQDEGDLAKCTINFRAGRYIYIVDNTLNDGTLGFGPGPWTPPSDVVEYVVIDGNTIHNAQVYIAGAVHHAVVRNNVLDLEGSAQVVINPIDPAGYASRYMSDITVTQNTGINPTLAGNFLEVRGAARPGTITLTNNLYSAPDLVTGANMSAAVLVDAADLSGFQVISGNVWPAGGTQANGGVNYVWGTWFGPGWQTADQWNAQSVVHNDTFRDVTLPDGVYTLALNGSTIGASGFAAAA